MMRLNYVSAQFCFSSDVITKRSRSNTGSVSEGKRPFYNIQIPSSIML